MMRVAVAVGLAAAVLAFSGDLQAQTCSAETVLVNTESFDDTKYKDPASSVDGWGTGAITPVQKTSMFSGDTQSVGQQLYVVADADWDKDGWRDLVALMLTPTCHLHYLKNKRTTGTTFNGFDAGTGATFTKYTIGTPPNCSTDAPVLLTGDFDGDGNKDVLFMRVKNQDTDGLLSTAVIYPYKSLTVDGVPVFGAPIDILSELGGVAWHWTGVEATVIDWPPADGIDDLVLVNSQGMTNQLRLYRGQAGFQFSNPQILIPNLGLATRIADATHPVGAAACPQLPSRGGTALGVGDFDGDGSLDVVVGSVSEKDLKFWKNDGSDNFAPATNIPFPEGAACVAIAADFDGDGDRDLMVGRDGKNCNGAGGTVWMFENDGKGVFTKHTTAIANLGGDLDFGIAFNMDNDAKGQIDAIFADGNDTGTYTTVVSKQLGVYNLSGTAISLPVADLTASNNAIVNVTAKWTTANTAPPSKDILVYLSNDDGKTWEQVDNGVAHDFSSYGSILRWKAVFKAPAETLTGDAAAFAPGTKSPPELSDISLTYERIDRRAYSRSALAWGDVDTTTSAAGERLYAAYYWYPGYQAHLLAFDIQNYTAASSKAIDRVDTNSNVTLSWDGGDKLASRVSSTRTIYAAYVPSTGTRATGRVAFNETELTSPTSTPTLQSGMAVDDATRLAALRFVRGALGDGTGDRTWKFYDPGHSSPVFLGAPNASSTHVDYMDRQPNAKTATYAKFASSNSSRVPMVYLGANDGMLHAFDGITGSEVWALIPNNLLAKVKNQRSLNAGKETYRHDFFVDGAVVIGDVFDGTSWKTIAVVAESKGQGKDGNNFYFAVDVTSPSDPKPLWEFTDKLVPPAPACTVPLTHTTTTCSDTCGSTCSSTARFVDDDGVIAIEAENPSTSTSTDGTHNWMVKDNVVGASADKFVQGWPDEDAGAGCADVGTCGAQMTYNLSVAHGGKYYTCFRFNNDSCNDDRTPWGLNGAWVKDLRVATSCSSTKYGKWQWVSGGSVTLPYGESTVNVWMGQDGARLDKILLKTTSGCPASTDAGPEQECCGTTCTSETDTDYGDESKEWPECGSGSGLTCCIASQKCKPIGACDAADAVDNVTGETWSPPVITRVLVDGEAKWIVLFGSGYNNRGSTTAVVGRSLYAVDAVTGAQLGRWGIDDLPTSALNPSTIDNALPAGAAVADFDPTNGAGDGYADRLYLGDLEGRLWRLDMSASAPATGLESVWTLTNIFDAGEAGAGARVWAPIITKPALAILTSPPSAKYTPYIYFGTGGDDLAPNDQAYAFYAIRDDGTSGTRTTLDTTNAQEFKVTAPTGYKYWSDPIVVNGAAVYFAALQGSIESVNPCQSLGGNSRLYGYGIRTISGSKTRAGQPVLDPLDITGKLRQTLVVRGAVTVEPTQAVTSTTKGQDVFGQKFSADSAADKPEVFALANAGAIVSSTAPLKVLYWREVPLP